MRPLTRRAGGPRPADEDRIKDVMAEMMEADIAAGYGGGTNRTYEMQVRWRAERQLGLRPPHRVLAVCDDSCATTCLVCHGKGVARK